MFTREEKRFHTQPWNIYNAPFGNSFVLARPFFSSRWLLCVCQMGAIRQTVTFHWYNFIYSYCLHRSGDFRSLIIDWRSIMSLGFARCNTEMQIYIYKYKTTALFVLHFITVCFTCYHCSSYTLSLFVLHFIAVRFTLYHCSFYTSSLFVLHFITSFYTLSLRFIPYHTPLRTCKTYVVLLKLFNRLRTDWRR